MGNVTVDDNGGACYTFTAADRIYRVNAQNTAGPWYGTSWNSGFKDIQSAVDAAAAGGEIWVMAGTYTAISDLAVAIMKSGVDLYGGFAGTESARGQRNWAANVSAIDGQNARCCVYGAGNATFDGFTVTGGDIRVFGGGIYNSGDALTVANCAFLSNGVPVGPGGVNAGGGMCNYGNSVAVTNCTFTQNYATNGAGICNSGNSLTVANCTFNQNHATTGGGIDNSGSSLTVANCTFSQNDAGGGGGIHSFGSSGSLTVTDCTFIHNSGTDGGGIYDFGSPLTAMNCTFNHNGATGGGGVYLYSTTSLTLVNCTFSQNHATQGGGIFKVGDLLTVTNCILWGDTAGDGPEIYNSSSAPAMTFSCVQGDIAGAGNINADPHFVAPPENVRLQTGSPCIDTGTATGAPAADITGLARPQGKGVDMGAYEIPLSVVDPVPPAISICAPNQTLSADDSCHAIVPDFTADVAATDNYDPSPIITQSPAEGSMVGLGDTTVTLTATDEEGNYATCTAILTVIDTTAPVITLNGPINIVLHCVTDYADPGATASDNCAGDLTGRIVTTSAVNPAVPGAYSVTYTVGDGNGSIATATRMVTVADRGQRPVITLLGANPVTVEYHSSYSDAGATAVDVCGGSLTAAIITTNPVNVHKIGT